VRKPPSPPERPGRVIGRMLTHHIAPCAPYSTLVSIADSKWQAGSALNLNSVVQPGSGVAWDWAAQIYERDEQRDRDLLQPRAPRRANMAQGVTEPSFAAPAREDQSPLLRVVTWPMPMAARCQKWDGLA
jgi:hypothetical protein